MRHLSSIAAALVLASAMGSAAAACTGPLPAAGTDFRGPVLDILQDGRLCVARGIDPSDWTPVRLDDLPAGVDRGALMGVAFARDVDCHILAHGGQAATAVCTIAGRSIGALSATDAARAAGQAWR